MGRPAAATKPNEKAATRSRRLEIESLLRFRKQRCRFNPDRCGLRVSNSFHLNVVSLMVRELVWILDSPDLVVAISHQGQLGAHLDVVFVGALLVAMRRTFGVRHPAFDGNRLSFLSRQGGDREE